MMQPNLTLDGHKLYFYYKIIGKPAKNLFNGTGEKICAQSVDFFSVWFLLEKLQHSKQKVKNVTAYLNIITQPFRPTMNNNVSWRMQKQKNLLIQGLHRAWEIFEKWSAFRDLHVYRSELMEI